MQNGTLWGILFLFLDYVRLLCLILLNPRGWISVTERQGRPYRGMMIKKLILFPNRFFIFQIPFGIALSVRAPIQQLSKQKEEIFSIATGINKRSSDELLLFGVFFSCHIVSEHIAKIQVGWLVCLVSEIKGFLTFCPILEVLCCDLGSLFCFTRLFQSIVTDSLQLYSVMNPIA